MRFVAFDLRAAGPRSYSHAIIDLGAVVIEDGEVVDEFHTLAGENRYLDVRPSMLEDARVQWKDVRAAGDYHGNVGDFCAFIDQARGSAPAWAFDAKERAAFVLNSLKFSKFDYGFDRVADVCALQGVMSAIGAAPPCAATQDAICHRLELPFLDPTVNALDRAKTAATAAALLEDQLRRHYSPNERRDRGNLLPAVPPFTPFDGANR